jgi:hypothetical protein
MPPERHVDRRCDLTGRVPSKSLGQYGEFPWGSPHYRTGKSEQPQDTIGHESRGRHTTAANDPFLQH